MSHNHHHTEENPKVSSTAAFFFILIIAGLALSIINFVRSMEHSDGHHGEAQHATAHNDPHTWNHPNQYNTEEMTAGVAKVESPTVVPHSVTNIVTVDTAHTATPVAKDTAKAK